MMHTPYRRYWLDQGRRARSDAFHGLIRSLRVWFSRKPGKAPHGLPHRG